MKKKKKSKKAAFDLEAFEKELEETTAKPADEAEAEEEGEDGPTGAIDYDEEELGDDVFAAPAGGAVGGDAAETWHGTDRDYTYAEVRPLDAFASTLKSFLNRSHILYCAIAPWTHHENSPRPKSRTLCIWPKTIHNCATLRTSRRQQEDYLR